ncbi:hypothetical protein [Actinomadura madurae]|uniref:hypothetical protein n=1 Tax=Actinomadura madurae TaxID=1993 RepID=UPI00399C48B7
MPAPLETAGPDRRRVGVPQYGDGPVGLHSKLFARNITLAGGVAHVRIYIDVLLPAVREGLVEPGRVFDRTLCLDDVAEGYRMMDRRDAVKVMVRP